MLFLNKKISLINDVLKGYLKPFGGVYYDIPAQTARTEKGLEPVIFKDNEFKFIGIDDIHELIVYHKHRASQVEKDIDESTETERMQMIVFANLERIGRTADEIGASIMVSFPTTIKKSLYQLPIQITSINLTSVNTDSYSIYQQEYGGQYQLPPHMALIAFDYTIESTFNRKECFDLCGCAGQ